MEIEESNKFYNVSQDDLGTDHSLDKKSNEELCKASESTNDRSIMPNLKKNNNNGDESQQNQVVQIQKRKKTPLKRVQFSYESVPLQGINLNQQDILYTYGDIVVDLAKISESQQNRFSAWNACKVWPITQISKSSRVFFINLENRYRPIEQQFNKQIQVYKQYPDQNIHNLIIDIEKHVELSKILQEYLFNYFMVIKQNPFMTRTYYNRRQQFDAQMENVYKDLSDQGAVFFASHSGPNIESNDFLFHKVVFSESLAQILGKSLEELQDMYRRNGAIDFFDFQSSLEVVRLMVQEQLQIFNSNNPQFYYQIRDKIPFKKQFKVFTYDDIIFYANVTLQMVKMSDFMNDSKNIFDFYAGILHFDISPSQLKQIITIREQNMQQKNNDSNQDYSQNLEYIIQAEIFKEKFIDPSSYSYNLNSKIEDKTCKYRQI